MGVKVKFEPHPESEIVDSSLRKNLVSFLDTAYVKRRYTVTDQIIFTGW